METLHEQGDVLLFSINEIPKTAKTVKTAVLHKGNTGNNHKIRGVCSIKDDGEQRYVEVKTTATIYHEEHKPIKLPKGKYILKFVQERDHFADLTRPVVD